MIWKRPYWFSDAVTNNLDFFYCFTASQKIRWSVCSFKFSAANIKELEHLATLNSADFCSSWLSQLVCNRVYWTDCDSLLFKLCLISECIQPVWVPENTMNLPYLCHFSLVKTILLLQQQHRYCRVATCPLVFFSLSDLFWVQRLSMQGHALDNGRWARKQALVTIN